MFFVSFSIIFFLSFNMMKYIASLHESQIYGSFSKSPEYSGPVGITMGSLDAYVSRFIINPIRTSGS